MGGAHLLRFCAFFTVLFACLLIDQVRAQNKVPPCFQGHKAGKMADSIVFDTSFDGDGIAVTSTGTSSSANDLAFQQDGKIVVAGGNGGFLLARYNVDGSLDNSFDFDGLVETPFWLDAGAAAVLVRPDNKVIAVGTTYGAWGKHDFALARYNYDGTLDQDFGGTGQVTIGSDYEAAYDAVLQPDGKIVLVGTSSYGLASIFRAVRVLDNGMVDSSFSPGNMDFPGSDFESAAAVALQPDGKILVAGGVENYGMGMVRLLSNGSLDNYFGVEGKLTCTNLTAATEIRLQPVGADFKILVLDGGFSIGRFNKDGSLDQSFGINGIGSIPGFGTSTSMALDSNGEIIAGGKAVIGGDSDFAIVRYSRNGFARWSATYNWVGEGQDQINAMEMLPDGKLGSTGSMAVGTFSSIATSRYVVAGCLCKEQLAQGPGPGMVHVPAGAYEMGDHHDGMSNALPVHTVFINGFFMDKYEVTNEEYATGLNWAWNQGNIITVTDGVVYKAGGGATCAYCDTKDSSEYSQITWNGSEFGVTEGKEDRPMAMLSWYGSAAYANWRSMMEGRSPCYDLETWECTFGAGGYRLPTEAEWEKAARGREYNPYYRYPWGDSLISSIANYDESGDPYEAGPEPWNTPVGFYTGELHQKVDFGWPGIEESYQTENGENGWGLYDMAGNEWEWCYDWYEEDYYSHSPKDNPTGPNSGVFRICRGGSWDGEYQGLRCAVRGIGNVPEVRSRSISFRLIMD